MLGLQSYITVLSSYRGAVDPNSVFMLAWQAFNRQSSRQPPRSSFKHLYTVVNEGALALDLMKTSQFGS